MPVCSLILDLSILIFYFLIMKVIKAMNLPLRTALAITHIFISSFIEM